MDTQEKQSHELRRSVTAADLAGGALAARPVAVQGHQLNLSGAEAPELAVDSSAVRSAAFAGPSEDSIDGRGVAGSSVGELEDLLGGLEEARAGLGLAQSDLGLVEWRVDDVRKWLRDECEVSDELREAQWDALRAVGEVGEAICRLIAALDTRIGVRQAVPVSKLAGLSLEPRPLAHGGEEGGVA